jgi:hypothetical protein
MSLGRIWCCGVRWHAVFGVRGRPLEIWASCWVIRHQGRKRRHVHISRGRLCMTRGGAWWWRGRKNRHHISEIPDPTFNSSLTFIVSLWRSMAQGFHLSRAREFRQRSFGLGISCAASVVLARQWSSLPWYSCREMNITTNCSLWEAICRSRKNLKEWTILASTCLPHRAALLTLTGPRNVIRTGRSVDASTDEYEVWLWQMTVGWICRPDRRWPGSEETDFDGTI